MIPVQTTGVQCTGEQYAAYARPLQVLQIGLVPHSASREDLSSTAALHDILHPFHFRAPTACDAAERHHDDSLRPQSGGGVQCCRSDETTAAIIQREHGTTAMVADHLPQRIRAGESLASHHRNAEALFLQTPVVVLMADARVDPQLHGGVVSVQALDEFEVVAGTGNGVQVGDIESAKGMQRNKSIGHRERIAIGAQTGMQCGIA